MATPTVKKVLAAHAVADRKNLVGMRLVAAEGFVSDENMELKPGLLVEDVAATIEDGEVSVIDVAIWIGGTLAMLTVEPNVVLSFVDF